MDGPSTFIFKTPPTSHATMVSIVYTYAAPHSLTFTTRSTQRTGRVQKQCNIPYPGPRPGTCPEEARSRGKDVIE